MISKLAMGLHSAAMMYDECNCRAKIEALDGPFDYWQTFERVSDFFALGVRGSEWHFNIRGTDGDNLLEKASAWASNLDFEITGGRHRGFYETAKWAFAELSEGHIPAWCLAKLERIIMNNHSRSTGVSPHLAIMLAERYRVPVEIYNYAYAPTFSNDGVKNIWDVAHGKYDIQGIRVRNPRDALCRDKLFGKVLRGPKPNDGCDVLSEVTLPVDRRIQKWLSFIPSAIEHSPKEYNDGEQVMFKDSRETVEYLKASRKMMEN